MRNDPPPDHLVRPVGLVRVEVAWDSERRGGNTEEWRRLVVMSENGSYMIPDLANFDILLVTSMPRVDPGVRLNDLQNAIKRHSTACKSETHQ